MENGIAHTGADTTHGGILRFLLPFVANSHSAYLIHGNEEIQKKN
jgi:hypothetical protein